MEGNSGVKCDGCHDRDLASGIISLYVCSRIRFRVAQLSCLLQSLTVVHPDFGHLCEDVIRCPVHDAHDLADLICSKAVLERADDRNTAGHRCLKAKIHMVLLRQSHQLAAVFRDQVLVGRHHALTCFQGFPDVGVCRLNAAHHLDHDTDLRIRHDILERLSKNRRIVHLTFMLLRIPDQDLPDAKCRIQFLRHLGFLRLHDLIDTGSNGAQPEKRYIHLIHRPVSSYNVKYIQTAKHYTHIESEKATGNRFVMLRRLMAIVEAL